MGKLSRHLDFGILHLEANPGANSFLRLIVFPLFICKAPQPFFTQFSGANHCMTSGFVVATGMLMLRRIAAKHFSAGLANVKMHPMTVDLDTIFTAKDRIICLRN
jgi:hypothetical protein